MADHATGRARHGSAATRPAGDDRAAGHETRPSPSSKSPGIDGRTIHLCPSTALGNRYTATDIVGGEANPITTPLPGELNSVEFFATCFINRSKSDPANRKVCPANQQRTHRPTESSPEFSAARFSAAPRIPSAATELQLSTRLARSAGPFRWVCVPGS